MLDSPLRLSRRRFMATGVAAGAYALLPALTFAGDNYRETSVPDGGLIQGKVVFKGSLPKPDQILISKDNEHCGEDHVNPDPARLSANGEVSRAIVAIANITAGKPWPQGTEGPSIVQERCAFHPYIQMARTRTELTIVNKDPLLHNIHAYELIGRARRSLFNIAQPAAGQVDTRILKPRRGNVIEIDCDAHNWMSAWIYLSDHPYVAVADEHGQFVLEDVPPGTFDIFAWHPVLGNGTQSVTVAAKTPSSLSIEITF